MPLPGAPQLTLLKPLTTFHWHGDTFDIPKGAFPLAGFEAVENQGFICNYEVIALLFHLEMNRTSIDAVLKNCNNDITNDKYVQSKVEIETGLINEEKNRIVLDNILTYLSGRLR